MEIRHITCPATSIILHQFDRCVLRVVLCLLLAASGVLSHVARTLFGRRDALDGIIPFGSNSIGQRLEPSPMLKSMKPILVAHRRSIT